MEVSRVPCHVERQVTNTPRCDSIPNPTFVLYFLSRPTHRNKMPPYEDWNRIDDEEDEELQDASVSVPNTIESLEFIIVG